jgi:hypothetical protein
MSGLTSRCSSSVPARNIWRAMPRRWNGDGRPTSAVSRLHAKSSPASRPMPRRFSTAWKTAKRKGLPLLSQTGRRPGASRASSAGSGMANFAGRSECGGNQGRRRFRPIAWGISATRWCRGSSASATQSQRYALYCPKPSRWAFPTWSSPLTRITSRHVA